jgi:hypothetical protein
VRAEAVIDPSRIWGADRTTAGTPRHPREGDEDLSEGSNSDPLASGGRNKPRSKRGRKPNSAGRTKASDVGRALRSVYDTTLREDVPRDFLDLLGKLR